MPESQRVRRQSLRFYFGLSVGLFVIVGVSQLMEKQLNGYFSSNDLSSKMVSVLLILLYIGLGAIVFLAIDAAYDGVISRMFGSEREA